MARAPKEHPERRELKNTGYEIFIGLLSILSIVNLVLLYATSSQSLNYILYVMNALLSMIFFGDFLFRLLTAPSKSGYFFRQFGWADLLASLPFPQTKVLRLFRVLRVYRLLKEYGVRRIGALLLADRAGSALYVLLLMGILVLEFGSLAMVYIEEDAPGANITSASDGLWYTIVTISTVGYGDQYPVTNAGRLMGVLIIVIGVGIFGTFTGYLANLFLSGPEPAPAPDPAEELSEAENAVVAEEKENAEQADLLREQVEQLRALLQEQQKSIDAVDRLLETKGS
jgi:voltage-gated potassium channel Kch